MPSLSDTAPLHTHLGLMTTDLPKSRRTMAPTWQRLAEAGIAEDLPVVFFHPHRIDLKRRTVTGVRYHPGTGWMPIRVPLPRVVVDNVYVHIARTDRLYAGNKRALEQRGTVVLNPRLPDKSGVWQALQRQPLLADHLPETAVMRSAADLERWLDRHESVFLKPVRGSGGRGVLRVSRDQAGTYRVAGAKKSLWRREEWSFFLKKRLGETPHLIQQGLSLFETEGCKIDLRIVLHRDGDRTWQPITTVPRMGAIGSVVTNLAQGGQVKEFAWLTERMTEQGLRAPQRERLEQIAVQAAEAVTLIRPTLAFLGLDLALDTTGRAYVLDINPRPGRKSLGAAERSRAFACLVRYCKTL
ncbi:YheC/YheD family protein [Tumebacillus sp. DT12]|uniref:YheC/YheD family protein n=1 Tax=Tumebacillus lacus TaxID=2995335 RepID=A0ABT3X6D9_9BACL|nr:YheC/YheD family protein [Tumebacillus lacus]MCX7572006.1 YheC/YheD family protein [Tumebacillus lacus]